MTEQELKYKLHEPYRLHTWQEILRVIFTRSDFFLPSAYQPLFEGVDFVQKAFQFGVITLADEKRLALVNVQLTDNKVIARNRGKSDQTVRNQLTILFKKISASNRSQAANWYRNNKEPDSVF